MIHTQRYARRRRDLLCATKPLVEHLESRLQMDGAIAVSVFNDLNKSNKRDTGDSPLAGWTVYLDLNESGAFDEGDRSAVTGSNGRATFDALAAGKYEVGQVMKSGFGPARSSALIDTVDVDDGVTTNFEFLNVAAAAGTITGTVWNDIAGNGIHEPSDPGIAGWTVFIDANDNRFLDAGERTSITDGSGRYTFTDVAAGRHRVRVIQASGWDTTVGSDNATTVDITAGQTRTVDFGAFNADGIGSIRGSVWNDVNADGFRGAGDPGIDAWTLFLDLDLDGVADAGEPTALTDAAGVYTFESIAVGSYRVTQVLKSGWNLSPGHPIFLTVIAGNEDPGIADFAAYTPSLGEINGRVYNDADGSGTLGAGEAGIGGWTVFADADNNGALGADERATITNIDGTYTITGLPIGSFNIRTLPAVGFTPTAPGTGVQLVRVLNGASVSGINFGNKQRTDSAISGSAFVDANKNGTRDAGERGLPGIFVFLDLNNDGTHDAAEPSTVTSNDLFYTPTVNEAGNYQFTHLAAGTYHVRQLVPAVLSATPAAARERTVTIDGGGLGANVDFANRYRANEIHGVVYDDANKNHVQDADEPGINGVTVYIDLDRDNRPDAAELRTITDINGVYSFTTNLGPGSYVVRILHHSGNHYSTPTTTSGILWPTGVSNPTIGNVTPSLIQTSLAKDQTEQHTVSLTLPTAGSLSNKVDVFLLFDDTGSFTSNSPIVRAAFPQIISTLQAAMPTVDFGFGVGRFEEYANFASENSTGRPFILNQPIVSANTPGFELAIQSALDRTAPGYGGDTPETDIEALFQAATGRGFDGNNNGTMTDSGAAGQVSTQLTPGDSGDVPAFGSFTVDASGNVLAPSGAIGGAGFRPGALPIILTATDTGFAFQPRGETDITGLNGLTLPVGAFGATSRPTTPFNGGAGIQETITALNALGALVIGLGTNGVATADPRQALEALAKLTGAVNRSATAIPNGTLDAIAPGDPLYFQISSGFGASVTNGIVAAIENAVANVDVNLTLKASDPRVHIDFSPEAIKNVGAGETATFVVTFTGDGRPHRFDLQFVREGTDVVLGSIPVVLGTPISGDGYDYIELEEGEIEDAEDFGDWYDATLPANVAPSFTKGANVGVAQGAGAQTITGWATGISAGEADQLVDFIVTTTNNSLFSVLPTIGEDGTLTFTPAAGMSGTATVTVRAHDTGGSAGGGDDTSAAQTFSIVINAPAVVPLTITSRFDFAARQAITIDFNNDVAADLSLDDVRVINVATGLPVALKSLAYDAVSKRATVLMQSPTLADGNYRLTIASGTLPNLATDHLMDFFVMAGDMNRDRKVDFSDLVILAQNYNKLGQTFAQGNLDYSPDGKVNFADLVMLAQRYNQTLEPVVVASKAPAVKAPLIKAAPAKKRARALSELA